MGLQVPIEQAARDVQVQPSQTRNGGQEAAVIVQTGAEAGPLRRGGVVRHGRRVLGPVRVVGDGDVERVVADERQVAGAGEVGEGFLQRRRDGLDLDAEGVVPVQDLRGFVVDLPVELQDRPREG